MMENYVNRCGNCMDILINYDNGIESNNVGFT